MTHERQTHQGIPPVHHESPSERSHQARSEARTNYRLVLAHISNPENRASAEDGRMCGDGRYETRDGKFARFGADAGYMLGLLSLNRTRNLGFSVTQIVDASVNATEGKFSFHTDEDAEKKVLEENDPSKIGCGHLGQSMLAENTDSYLVDPDEVKEAVIYLKHLALTHPDKVEMTILRGPHREIGLIKNLGREVKIKHGDGRSQWFMVGVTRDEEYTPEFFKRATALLPEMADAGITHEDFRATLDAQTTTTGGILAHNLPAYEIDIDGELPVIDRVQSF